MIDLATPARRSCVTVDCALIVLTPPGSAATQLVCRNCASVWPAAGLPAKMRRNTSPHYAVTRSMSPMRQLSVSYQFVWLVLPMSAASRSSLNTQHCHERQLTLTLTLTLTDTEDPNARIQKFIHYMATTPQLQNSMWIEFAHTHLHTTPEHKLTGSKYHH